MSAQIARVEHGAAQKYDHGDEERTHELDSGSGKNEKLRARTALRGEHALVQIREAASEGLSLSPHSSLIEGPVANDAEKGLDSVL